MSIRSTFGTVAFAASMLLPIAASAMQPQIFDFAENHINARWEGKGAIQMKQTPNGILLSTTGTGVFITDTDLTVTPQAGSITVSTENPVSIALVWFYTNDPEQQHDAIIDLPSDTAITVPFSLAHIPNWSSQPKKIGLILLPGTRILLHQIRFDAFNPLERTLEAIRSFWTFDRYQPYSINFVWGPQFETDPIAREDLFYVLPPVSVSATFVLNVLLVFAVVGLCIYGIATMQRRRALLLGGSFVLALWILLDLRMGSEFLTWVLKDRQMYISQSESMRTFRDRDRFYDFAAFAAPLVKDRGSYIFFAEQQWPYLGNMRYLTYPSIPGIDLAHDDTWVIYRRSDVTVMPDGALAVDGLPVTGHGQILGRFDDRSFIFRSDRVQTTPDAS